MTENQKRKIIRVELLETFAEINDALKADKDVEAVLNNLAKFDENGNPVDSGINVNDLSAVTTTGDYNDLLNKPTIPSVGDAEIEIQKNGTKINSFTTNQSGSKVTINIPVPTGTAADKDVPSSGNASNTQVVLGNDTRLSDSRPASDVYSWAKAESKPSYTKSEIGLENVTNDSQVKRTEMGTPSGVATLDENGKVPSSQLPSYVDDVLEYNTKSAFPTTGETGKIYVDKSNNTTWRWSGSTYSQIKGDLVIGTASGNAADGKIANDHYSNTSNPHSVTKSQVGLGSVVNTGDSATPVSGGTTKFTTGGAYTELNKKVDKVDGKGLSTNDYTTDEKNKLSDIESGAQKHKAPTAAEVKSALGTGSGTSKYLREDGTWVTPQNDNTTYQFSQSGNTLQMGTNGGSKSNIYTPSIPVSSVAGKTGAVTLDKSDVGLGNVGNFKAVSTAASQGLTDTEKSNARANIGAGTSSFSGSYDDLTDKPTIPELPIMINSNGHDYVEIGGIKWATMNVGANSITDYGLYFQWGDTQGYTASQVGSGSGQKAFTWADYKYCNGTKSVMTKYNGTDGKTVLEASDDAVQANWGGGWRMPTTDEFAALGAAVNSSWTSNYQGSGVAGFVLTDKSDSSKVLFFPAAGYSESMDLVGVRGYYWSSSVYSSKLLRAYYFYFNDDNITSWQNSGNRCNGCSVRGILDDSTQPSNNTSLHKVAVTGDYNDLENKPTIPDAQIQSTWANLKSLRDNSQLVPGQWYRITDYTCTTTQENTQSAGHVFDVIVRADSVNVLNEDAYAALHSGDTYFANSKLEAWKLSYCLDNDTNRFTWADSTNGKGVIYYMKDEWDNECPYDFKNIQFKRWKTTASGNMAAFNNTYLGGKDLYGDPYPSSENVSLNDNDTKFFFTFSLYGSNYSTIEDGTVAYGESYPPYDNSIRSNYDAWGDFVTENTFFLNDLVFEYNSSAPYGNHLGTNCYFNTFGNGCYGNSFGNNNYYNTFGNGCYGNSFGNNNYYNTFGNDCNDNSFGNSCSSNTFGNDCNDNSFGNSCSSNTFGNSCSSNTFGNNNYYNTFGNSCYGNTFGNGCYGNSFGNSCSRNTFGKSCQYITFSKDYCYYNIVENGNSYITLTSTQTTSNSNMLRNIKICLGVNNTTTTKTISHDTLNDTFQTEYKPANSQVITV